MTHDVERRAFTLEAFLDIDGSLMPLRNFVLFLFFLDVLEIVHLRLPFFLSFSFVRSHYSVARQV